VDVVWRPKTSPPPDLIIFRRARRGGRVLRYLFLSISRQLGLRPFSNKLARAVSISSAKLGGGCFKAARLALSIRTVSALGEGQNPRAPVVRREAEEDWQLTKKKPRYRADGEKLDCSCLAMTRTCGLMGHYVLVLSDTSVRCGMSANDAQSGHRKSFIAAIR
jgi:hypothetical protein